MIMQPIATACYLGTMDLDFIPLLESKGSRTDKSHCRRECRSGEQRQHNQLDLRITSNHPADKHWR